MALLKNDMRENFTQIPNALILDIRISQGAFRVACLLFSKPSGWKVFNKSIQKDLGIRKTDTLSKYWKELEELGWIERTKITDPKNGVVGAYDYLLNLSPKMGGTPEDGVHHNGDYPKMGEHSNTNSINNTKESNTNLNLEAFEMWCKYKGKNYSKQGKTLSTNKLIEYPKDIQMKMVENSIMNNYKGLFEVKAETTSVKNKFDSFMDMKEHLSANFETYKKLDIEFEGHIWKIGKTGIPYSKDNVDDMPFDQRKRFWIYMIANTRLLEVA